MKEFFGNVLRYAAFPVYIMVLLLSVHQSGASGSHPKDDYDARSNLELGLLLKQTLARAADKCSCGADGQCECTDCPGCSCKKCKCSFLTYDMAYRLSMKKRLPLVVFVSQPLRRIAGAVCVRVDEFQDVEGRAVVVGLPDGKSMKRLDIPGSPTDSVIMDVARGKDANDANSCGVQQVCPGGK